MGPQRKFVPSLIRAHGIAEKKTPVFTSLLLSDQIAVDDSFFYLGTTTGDILKMNPRTKLLADTGPAKDKFSLVSTDPQSLLCPALFR